MIQNGYCAGGSNPEFLVGVTGADESRDSRKQMLSYSLQLQRLDTSNAKRNTRSLHSVALF